MTRLRLTAFHATRALTVTAIPLLALVLAACTNTSSPKY